MMAPEDSDGKIHVPDAPFRPGEEAMGGEPVVTRDSTGSAVSHVLSQKRLIVAEVDNS